MFQLSIKPEGDLRAYSAEATEIAAAWFDLAAGGSEVAHDAYLCKAKGFEQMAMFFGYVESAQAANLEGVRRIREFLPAARIAANARYADQVDELRSAGVDVARNLHEEAGQALADDAVAVVWEREG